MSQLLAGMSLQVPPLLLSTLVKHFLSRKKITADSKARDELLYDEVGPVDMSLSVEQCLSNHFVRLS